MTDFATLTLTRTLKASPARVFDALTNPKARAIWAGPDVDSVVEIVDQPDPAPGVRETAQVGPAGNPYVTAHTDWIVMEAPDRLIYAETLVAEGETLAVTLAVAELSAQGDGTQLDLHLDLTSFVGEEMRGEVESGWTHAIDSLVKLVETANV